MSAGSSKQITLTTGVSRCFTHDEFEAFVNNGGCIPPGAHYTIMDGPNKGDYRGPCYDGDDPFQYASIDDLLPDDDITDVTPTLLADGSLRIQVEEGGTVRTGTVSLKDLLKCVKQDSFRAVEQLSEGSYTITAATPLGVIDDSIVEMNFTVPADAHSSVHLDLATHYGWRQTIAPTTAGDKGRANVRVVYSIDGGAWQTMEWGGGHNIHEATEWQGVEQVLQSKSRATGTYAPGSTVNVRYALDVQLNASAVGAEITSFVATGDVTFDYLCLVS